MVETRSRRRPTVAATSPRSLDASRSMDEDASDDERDLRPAFDAYDLLFVIDVFVSTQMSSSVVVVEHIQVTIVVALDGLHS